MTLGILPHSSLPSIYKCKRAAAPFRVCCAIQREAHQQYYHYPGFQILHLGIYFLLQWLSAADLRISYSKKRNVGFNCYQIFCSSFFPTHQGRAMRWGSKPYPPYFFSDSSSINANGGHSFKTFLEKTLISLTSVEVQWQR